MQILYASIIVDIANGKLDKHFQYRIPEEFIDSLCIGMVVEAPFGKGNRIIKGYVIDISDKARIDVTRIKSITRIVTGDVEAESKLIALAGWIRKNYGATMIQALKTVLPIKVKVKSKEKKRVCLLISEEEARHLVSEWERKHYTAKARLLGALLEENILSYELITTKLSIASGVIKNLEKQEILQIESEQIYRNPVLAEGKESLSCILNEEQRIAVDIVLKDREQALFKTYLLHGITGSGKTEVYIELIHNVIAQKKQAIVLIPEIALTYQTVMRFYKHFGNRISIINSRMSKGERYDQFERAKKGQIDIMIGPRSALFTPFSNLGIIIIDEEHEGTYKSESVPRYHARETAIQRAKLEEASVVLGSATPSIDAYYKAISGEYTLLELTVRAKKSQLPKVYTIDLRKELKSGNRSIISGKLNQLIEDRLKKKQQIILFLNRRGYAGFISCRSCGYVMKCPHCDVSLNIHNHGKLVCHYCGHEENNVNACPSCSSGFIGRFKAGTQQIEEVVKKAYPNASVLRMDMDTTKTKTGHEEILSAFANQEADILIGTQMIVKGHDFPNVTLVGILAADLSLNVSSYHASERTFQLLTQAAGRAGRGEEMGEVVIQTYNPEHYSIVTANKQDYSGFYNEEIIYRRLMGYPPISNMLAIHISGKEEETLDVASMYLKKYIEQIYIKAIQIIGPTNESISKINDIYRKIIYIKHSNYELLTWIKDKLEQYIEVNNGFNQINIQFDFNPMN